jgi:ketosteroid isomerase-like protein
LRVPRDALELVREIYGYNWASTSDRREGLDQVSKLFGERFEYQLDPSAFGDRTLTDVPALRTFLEGIDEDFRDFRQRPDEFIDAGATEAGERVVVLGELVGRGRASGLPFRSPFGHVWTVRDAAAVRLEGYLDHDVALAAAGLGERVSELR